MAKFGNQREFVECAPKLYEVIAILGSEAKRGRHLHHDATDSFCARQRLHGLMESFDTLAIKLPFMGEVAVQFHREPEIRVHGDMRRPERRGLRPRSSAERGFDLEAIDTRSQIAQRVKVSRAWIGINLGVPGRVLPACDATPKRRR